MKYTIWIVETEIHLLSKSNTMHRRSLDANAMDWQMDQLQSRSNWLVEMEIHFPVKSNTL